MVRAVLLDAMGTLLELDPPAPRLRHELRERANVELTLAEAGSAMAAEIGFYRAHHQAGRDRASLAGLRRECAVALRDALPGSAGELPLDVVGGAMLAAIHFRVYPEAISVLERLRGAGVHRVVVSNWDVSLHEVLQEVGLAPLLSGTITSAELGASKPSPAIFRHALTLAGVPARDAVMVGDSVLEDVDGARAVGVTPVLVARDGAVPEVDGVRVIRSLRELPKLVA